MDAAIARLRSDPSEQNYEAVFATMEATAVPLDVDDCWYALRNYGRGKYYMKNISSRLTSSSSLISTGAGQHFRFVRADGDGRYYVQCAKDMSYLSPTGSDSQQLTLVAHRADAGIYTVSSSLQGLSVLSCQNPTGSHRALTLNETCDKVLPAAPSDASRWFIEVTAFIPTGLDEAEADEGESGTWYDLAGRSSDGNRRGFFVVGNKKIWIK